MCDFVNIVDPNWAGYYLLHTCGNKEAYPNQFESKEAQFSFKTMFFSFCFYVDVWEIKTTHRKPKFEEPKFRWFWKTNNV